MVTTLVTTIGVVAGDVTMNPIVLGCVSGAGILAQSYVMKSGIGGMVSRCKYAYVTYEKVLSLIKSHLRGAPYEEHTLHRTKTSRRDSCRTLPTTWQVN